MNEEKTTECVCKRLIKAKQQLKIKDKIIELMAKDLKEDANFYGWLASGKAKQDI